MDLKLTGKVALITGFGVTSMSQKLRGRPGVREIAANHY